MTGLYESDSGRTVRVFGVGWALLSALALVLSAWILFDLQREQEIVARISHHLPQSDMEVAGELTNDMRLQGMLSVLLALNIVGTAIAFAFVIRAYFSSERSLRDAKVLATDIRASIDAAIITTDLHGIITSVNPQGRELIGMGDHCVGRALSELSGEFDGEHVPLESMCRDVLDKQRSIRNRDYAVTSNAHKRTLRAGCALLRNQKQEAIGTVVHVTDVTEKVLIEDRLRRMERYMGLGSLAAGLLHEIRNPLSALSLHFQLLKEKISENQTNEEVLELLDVLQTETHRVNSVLDGFGNYASMKELGRSTVDVAFLMEKLARLLRPQAAQQRILIKLELPDLPFRTIQADSVQLEQVLLNLALNAMSAMRNGGQMTIRVEADDDWLHILVRDTGHGIPPEIQSRIFDPYFTTRNDGTGMGLALCDKIVRQHGGNIDFRTGADGTEFHVSLPWEATL